MSRERKKERKIERERKRERKNKLYDHFPRVLGYVHQRCNLPAPLEKRMYAETAPNFLNSQQEPRREQTYY